MPVNLHNGFIKIMAEGKWTVLVTSKITSDLKQRFSVSAWYPTNKLRNITSKQGGDTCDMGLLNRYLKLRVAHAPRMPGTFSPPPRVSDPVMHHGTCVTHMLWCMPDSLTSGFLWSRWRGKRSRYSRRTRNPLIYISGKRPIACAANLYSCHTKCLPLNPCFKWFIRTLRPRQNDHYFPDVNFKRIFLNENIRILIKSSLTFFPTIQLTIFQHCFR